MMAQIPKSEYKLRFTLLSDATFGRGDGVAGLVNEEVEHDRYGLPFIRGRMIKGLLNEECANILYSLAQVYGHKAPQLQRWRRSAQNLFGLPGSQLLGEGWLRFGNATLPEEICVAVRYELDYTAWAKETNNPPRRATTLDQSSMLESLTAIRRQTMLNEEGVPVKGSLRAMRVLLRGTQFEARLFYLPQHADASTDQQIDDLALLAATVMGWRRGGSGRNRGRGKLLATLCDGDGNDVTPKCFKHFSQQLTAKLSLASEEEAR